MARDPRRPGTVHPHEESIVQAFIVAPRRPRYLLELGDGRRRRKALGRLNHLRDLDGRYVEWLPSNADVASLLRARGAPERCYVLGGDDTIDGLELGLDEAVHAVWCIGWGAIVGCIPGKLAYYYDEGGDRRALLERP